MSREFHGSREKPLILIVDDIVRNLQVLGQILYGEGFEIAMAENGQTALSILERVAPDLILLDIGMPDMDGYEVCRRIKENAATMNIPVIFVTANTESEGLVRAFESGGVDYITKPFNQKELLARIKTHLELKFSRELIEKNAVELNDMNSRLVESNASKDEYLQIINEELTSAAEYVNALLTKPIDDKHIKTDWRFIPSSKLGGDSFGYHWIDDENFAAYLLDVSGHGIRPALHSVFVLSMLRSQALSRIDFTNPSQVLRSLNESFQMTEHKGLYFTIWYGVYNKNTRELKYSSAGHPPAYLKGPNSKGMNLATPNYGIGLFSKFPGISGSTIISPGSSLFIFSDGAYEIKDSSAKWSLEELYDYLERNRRNSEIIGNLYSLVLEISGNKILDDDFSMLKITFK